MPSSGTCAPTVVGEHGFTRTSLRGKFFTLLYLMFTHPTSATWGTKTPVGINKMVKAMNEE
jgi:hypothetical protein